MAKAAVAPITSPPTAATPVIAKKARERWIVIESFVVGSCILMRKQ
jgi:hypothetical protein